MLLLFLSLSLTTHVHRRSKYSVRVYLQAAGKTDTESWSEELEEGGELVLLPYLDSLTGSSNTHNFDPVYSLDRVPGYILASGVVVKSGEEVSRSSLLSSALCARSRPMGVSLCERGLTPRILKFSCIDQFNPSDSADTLKKASTWLSTDGGVMWFEVRRGAHAYEIGDHGSLILIMEKGDSSDCSLRYSWSGGLSWERLDLGRDSVSGRSWSCEVGNGFFACHLVSLFLLFDWPIHCVQKYCADIDNIRNNPGGASDAFVLHGLKSLIMLDFNNLQVRACRQPRTQVSEIQPMHLLQDWLFERLRSCFLPALYCREGRYWRVSIDQPIAGSPRQPRATLEV